MSLSIEEKKTIIAYRIQKAKATMIEAQDNAKLGLGRRRCHTFIR